MDLLFVGIGWTDLAITLNRIAVGAFFLLQGITELFNAERHRSFVDELRGWAFMRRASINGGCR